MPDTGKTPRITLSMLVRNEENRYLGRVLTAARDYIDDAVIIDDASTDNTAALCRQLLHGIPLKLVQNTESKFHREWAARQQQWSETVAENPEWIIFLDADEIFEDKFAEQARKLAANPNCDMYLFRLYDFWDEEHFREDEWWRAHLVYRPFMLRYQPGFPYRFCHHNQHCGRMPSNVFELNYQLSQLRLKHYGWAREEDRQQKYERYMRLDPQGIYGSRPQYQSILDTKVNLLKWQE